MLMQILECGLPGHGETLSKSMNTGCKKRYFVLAHIKLFYCICKVTKNDGIINQNQNNSAFLVTINALRIKPGNTINNYYAKKRKVMKQ